MMLGAPCSPCCCGDVAVGSISLVWQLEVAAAGQIIYVPSGAYPQLTVGQTLSMVQYRNLLINRLSVAYQNSYTVPNSFPPLGSYQLTPMTQGEVEATRAARPLFFPAWDADAWFFGAQGDTPDLDGYSVTQEIFNGYSQQFSFESEYKLVLRVGRDTWRCAPSDGRLCFAVEVFAWTSTNTHLINVTPDGTLDNGNLNSVGVGMLGLREDAPQEGQLSLKCISKMPTSPVPFRDNLAGGLAAYTLSGPTLAAPPSFLSVGSITFNAPT